MSLLVAPYNNGMRLGQGFNSYTHEICIDDAVLVHPERAENVLRNDGTTMRILAQQIGKPSVWRQMKEYVVDGVETKVDTEVITASSGVERVEDKGDQEVEEKEEEHRGSSIKRASEVIEETPKTSEVVGPDSAVIATTAKPSPSDPVVESESRETPAAAKTGTVDPVETPKAEKKAELKPDGQKVEVDEKVAPTQTGSDGTKSVVEEDKGKEGASEEVKTDVAPGKQEEEKDGESKSELPAETPSAEKKKTTTTTEVVPANPADKALAAKETDLKAREAESKAKQDAINKKNLEEHKVQADATHEHYGRKEDDMKLALKTTEAARKAKEKARAQTFDVSAKHELLPWSAEQARGTSQIVSFTAKFIDKLSEITDDMNLSGALSIKKSSFGVSGRGSYVNTDRFHDSDVKFYISVKVVNQSINFKDALEFCPVRSVPLTDQEKFNKVFGDSFISGFLEGGEFNALITMKILNKAKKSDIEAEAKIAFTTSGGLKFDGGGNVALAKANISLNTQTHIQVSWCGGGSLKDYNEEWTIDSLLAAATRFPALVAQFPQRTYAILTKYNSLRSFLRLKPASLSPLRYESAALYTNQLMDIFMGYKSLYKNISSDILDIQNGIKRFTRLLADAPPKVRSSTLINANLHFYPSTLEGLDLARREIRRQMNAIAAEVHAITDDPSLATKDEAGKDIVGCASFECLLPEIELKIGRSSAKPLTGQRINKPIAAAPDDVAEPEESNDQGLFDDTRTKLTLSTDETSKILQLERDYSWMTERTRVTAPVGNVSKGDMFCTLDLAQIDPVIAEISVGRRSEHTGTTVGMLSVTYTNGLQYTVGGTIEEYFGEAARKAGHTMMTLSGLGVSERLISATIEVDAAFNETEISIVGLHFRTNKGRQLKSGSEIKHQSELFKSYRFDKAMTNGCISGFWGRADAGPGEWGMERLGLVWSQVQAKQGYFEEEDAVASDGGKLAVSNRPQQHEFAYQTPSLPQLIWSMNGFDVSSGGLMAGVQVDNVNGAGFSYQSVENKGNVEVETPKQEATIKSISPTLGMDWMVLPELQSCHIQEGHVQATCKARESSHSIPISFDMPFADKEEPVVRCWITGFKAQTGYGSRSSSIKVLDGRRTRSGFELTVHWDGGIRLEGISIGWVAHSPKRVPDDSVKPVEGDKKPAEATKAEPGNKAQSNGATAKSAPETASAVNPTTETTGAVKPTTETATAAKPTTETTPPPPAQQPEETVAVKEEKIPDMIMTPGDDEFISGSMLWTDSTKTSRELQHSAFGPDDQPLLTFCGVSEVEWVTDEGIKLDFKIDKKRDDEIIIHSPEDARFIAARMIWICTAKLEE